VHQVEVGGERHVAEAKEAKAWMDGADELRIEIKAVIDGVDVERELTFFRYKNEADRQLKAWASAPGGREADKRRLKALSIVIFGNEPSIMSDGGKLRFIRRHLEYAMRFKELKDVVERWLTRWSNFEDLGDPRREEGA